MIDPFYAVIGGAFLIIEAAFFFILGRMIKYRDTVDLSPPIKGAVDVFDWSDRCPTCNGPLRVKS